MKKVISLLMCVVLLCSMFAVSVTAAENHFDTFHSETMKLWFAVVFGGGEDNIYEFTPLQIKWVTNFKIDATKFDSYEELVEYTYGDKTYSYTIIHYQIPADVYESEALKHFNISDINTLRNDTYTSPVYNAEAHIYDMPDGGGMGDSITYATKGYKDLGNGKYEVYGYTVEQAYEVPDGAVLGVDYIIMPEYGNAAEILKCLRITIEYNGADVKFLSWETIALEEMPNDGIVKNPEISFCKERTVYVTENGKKFHASSLCSNMKEPVAKKISDAESAGYTACSKCVSESFLAADLPHISSDWKTDKKATVNAKGKKHKECTECGKVLETATIAQLKAGKPKLKSIETTEHGVLIKWGKVSGADKYRVYRKTSKSDWECIATTSNTYYTDKTAKSGTKYYYAVKSQNEAGNSSLSNEFSKYYLADPTLKTPKSTKSGVKLEWSKVKGADGYYVYCKTGSKGYERIATVKGSTKVTYTDKTAKKGKKYTYKVKAYKSKTYSAYSNTKTITDKY